MTVRPLRTILSKQIVLVALFAVVIIALGVGLWLYPVTRANTQMHQQQIAVAVASRVASYLDGSSAAVKSIASLQFKNDKAFSRDLQLILDSQVAASNSIEIIYVAERNGTVRTVAMRDGNDARRHDLTGIDLSRNPLYHKVAPDQPPVWSDTFLSVVGGNLSVAQASAGNDLLVVAEIRLDRLVEYLAKIGKLGGEEIYLLDRHGNVIADDRNRYTAKQLNLKNLAMVRRCVSEDLPVVDTVTIHGVEMVGSCVPIRGIGWSVLVTKPVSKAYAPLWKTLGVLGGSMLLTLGLGVYFSFLMAGKLSHRFELLAEHARQVSAGGETAEWPTSNIAEFQELSADLQLMADTIREREQELSTLMRNVPGMIYRCANDPGWTMHYVSDGCLDLTGYPPAALLGNNQFRFSDLIREEDRERIWLEVQEALLHRRPYSLKYRIVTAKGTQKWVGDHGQGIFASEGDSLSLEGVITDITEQVQLEEQLRQSQKMDSIGQLAGGVAHDFNNMLTVIVGSAEILHMGLGEGHPLQKSVQMIQRASSKSAELTNKLLLFSRKAPRQSRLIDLHHVLREALHLLERSIDKRIKVCCSLMDEPAPIMGDATQLESAFLNLGINARDAMPEGGEIRVTTRTVNIGADEARRLGEHLSTGTYVVAEISDTGVGMQPEVLTRIFEPFFTTKPVGKGTGLGLAAVYGTITEHGAAITVHSEPGHGSTFSLYFPLRAAAGSAPIETTETTIPPGKRVLLVDDEEFLRQIGNAILNEMGIDVLLAANGREAVDIYAERGKEIDLVLLDVVMPILNGKDTFKELQLINPAVRTIFMSGYASNASLDDLLCEPNVFGFIQKPYRIETLKQLLAEALTA